MSTGAVNAAGPESLDDDAFDLQDKNPRRVAPAVRRNIQLQKARVLSWCIVTPIAATVGIAGFFASWIPTVLSITFLALAPFGVLGIYCDWRILQHQRARLAECECRIAASRPSLTDTSEPAG
jgi:hypothetical protein